MKLQDRIVLITGGGSGIGRAVAIRFAAAGAQVAVSGRREDRLRETAEEIAGAGGHCLTLPGDITDPSDAEAQVHETVEVLFDRDYRKEVPISRGAHALVDGWNEALVAILAEFEEDLRQVDFTVP